MTQRIDRILAIAPVPLIVSKVVSYHQRRGKPKSGTDWCDLAMLLLAFPELKQESGEVWNRLRTAGVDDKILALWQDVVATTIEPEDDDW